MDVEDELAFDPTKKKRKRTKKEEPIIEEVVEVAHSDEYSYSDLLSRVYATMSEESSSTSKSKKTIEPPEVGKVGSKRVIWTNISSICRTLNREVQHLMTFTLTELGATGSLDGRNNLVIKGRYNSVAIESIVTKYIKEYVSCSACRFLNTDLKKTNRITTKMCKDCGASSSVNPIAQGFSVQGKRKKM